MDLLDHGYLRFVEYWGSDERVIEAARMSNEKGFRSWEPYFECTECGEWWLETEDCPCEHSMQDWRKVPNGDMGLLSYLSNKKHTTPFEMAGMVIEIKAPIMVFREWHRHRTQSYNEMSGRYIALPDENYVPAVERLMVNSKTNKQAGTIKGAEQLTEFASFDYLCKLERMYKEQEELYQWALGIGVPKELARLHVGVGRYSKMRACANLLNWLRFLTLRMAPDAQWEIRQYANAVGKLVEEKFPRTWKLFVERKPS